MRLSILWLATLVGRSAASLGPPHPPGSTISAASAASGVTAAAEDAFGSPMQKPFFNNLNASILADNGTYMNPILKGFGADPWVIRHGEYYYLMSTADTNITLRRSKALTDWNFAEKKTIWHPPRGKPYSTSIWAPEMHHINGTWYVIFTADPARDIPHPEIAMYCDFECPGINHRMYVLEGRGSDPWTAKFKWKSKLDSFHQFAIDGTYFRHSTGLYHIYSCWYRQYDVWPANLCITKMLNPWTVASNLTQRTIISIPSNPWEQTPYGRPSLGSNQRLATNEGPEQLINPVTGQNFVIFSAGRSDNRNYCLGLLELVGDDPMSVQDWRKHNDGCVFHQNTRESVYGVGHASFTTSPDGTENWIVYHGMRDTAKGWGGRTIRAQKFTWNADGTPKFPRPGYGPYPLPSGQRPLHNMHIAGFEHN